MHQTRKESSIKLPITRKGTKYIARASSHIKDAVPVVIAVRDMLKLAKNTSEVKKMINQKLLKVNGRLVKDHRESILLFNILEAGKSYELSLLPTGKFVFVPSTNKNIRLCKVINRRLIKGGVIQLNLHDGTNIITKENISVGDSIYLDLENKFKKHVELAKGKDVFMMSGKYIGNKGKIKEMDKTKLLVQLNDGGSAKLDSSAVAVI